MKRKEILSLAFVSLLLMGLASACKHVSETAVANAVLNVESYTAADSSKYAHLDMKVDLPLLDGPVAQAIRQQLVSVLGERLSHVTSYESDQLYPTYDGDATETKSLLDYYREQTMKLLASLSQSDVDERIKYINEAEELSAEEKALQINEIPKWEYSYELTKVADTLGYVVFLSQDYIYMGGAHGGVGGDGYLTFDREDGTMVEQMLDSACVEQIQPLLVKGLLSYYNDCEEPLSEEDMRDRLQIEGDIIPLPVQQPCPSKDGLVFTYQQYEIASYADGMPSFVIAYDKIAPFMTPRAKKVCAAFMSF